MDFYEAISLAKIFAQIMGGNNSITITDAELETAAKLLKDMGNNRQDWSPQQKETYKAMVDFAKENSKGQKHG